MRSSFGAWPHSEQLRLVSWKTFTKVTDEFKTAKPEHKKYAGVLYTDAQLKLKGEERNS